MSVTATDVYDDVLKAPNTYRQQRRSVFTLYVLSILVMVALFDWLLNKQYQQEIKADESRITARANVVTEWAKGIFALKWTSSFWANRNIGVTRDI